MRKQIAAANWKMHLTYQNSKKLLEDVLNEPVSLKEYHQVVFAVPFPYLRMARKRVKKLDKYFVAAQNCHTQKSGAFTGEVSAEMLRSVGIDFVVLGHSERREYFNETNGMLAQKLDIALEFNLTPIFCCGEPLAIREAGQQNAYVETQLKDSLLHLDNEQIKQIVIAYEPIWAIGTGKTATADQAQEMHAHLRSLLAGHYGTETAESVSILYGGSVKGNNASELFSQPDVDGGLVGGASLNAAEFVTIIQSLK